MPKNWDDGLTAYSSGDFAKALSIWRPLAEEGDEVSLFHLAVMYERGDGVNTDTSTAVELFRRSAEKGFPYAVFALAEREEPLVKLRLLVGEVLTDAVADADAAILQLDDTDGDAVDVEDEVRTTLLVAL